MQLFYKETMTMRYSNLYVPTLRETPKEAQVMSHQLMLRSGMIRPLGSGMNTQLPLGKRMMDKLDKIIDEEFDRIEVSRLHFPALHPATLWKNSGRWEAYGDDMFKFQDRHGRDMCMAPTHEVVAADLVRESIRSYKDLPIRFYQTQIKYRDEMRPRGGVLRTREFTMKDMYSFDTDQAGVQESYARGHRAYCRVYARAGLRYLAVETSDTGLIGGDWSHEFFALSDAGEDTLYYCDQCGHGIADSSAEESACFRCDNGKYREVMGIEVGHIFQLGTQYSEFVNLVFTDEYGEKKYVLMCSFGLGLERTIAAVIEQNHDEKGIIWPAKFAPFQFIISPLFIDAPELVNFSEELYARLKASDVDVLLDDRNVSPGVKFADAELIGIPIQIVIGKGTLEREEVEIKTRRTGDTQKVRKDDVLDHALKALKTIGDVEECSRRNDTRVEPLSRG
jgi:prolyl-tRNA synthetase